MYLSGVGFAMILAGIVIASDFSDANFEATIALIFSGGIFTVVFLV